MEGFEKKVRNRKRLLCNIKRLTPPYKIVVVVSYLQPEQVYKGHEMSLLLLCGPQLMEAYKSVAVRVSVRKM